jgi:hypothetical protein
MEEKCTAWYGGEMYCMVWRRNEPPYCTALCGGLSIDIMNCTLCNEERQRHDNCLLLVFNYYMTL